MKTAECTCYGDGDCDVCQEERRQLSETTGKMIESMRLIPTESGRIMRDIFSTCLAANFSGLSVRGEDGKCPVNVVYTFADGTKITWTRPNG